MPESKDKDYSLERKKITPKEKEVQKDAPIYFEKLELSDDDKMRLQKEIWAEWKVIKDERDDDKLEKLWEALDNQYDAKLKDNKSRQFNIDKGTTAVKVDKVVSLIMKAFMSMDPKYAITPRPEFARNGGTEICQRQSDFIDDRLDNLPFRDMEGMAIHNAVLKGTGILKVTHKIKREKHKREETYKGTPTLVIDPQTGEAKVNLTDNKPIIVNKGLEDFLKAWPDAEQDYPQFVEDFKAGKEITLITEYIETTYNDPYFESIELKNFFVRKMTEGLEGLKTAKLIVERRQMTWWDLKHEENEGNFYDIDKIVDKALLDESGEDQKKGEYKHKTYNILECTYLFKLKDTDDEEVKIKAWFEEEKKVNIGAILYPYYLIDCEYIPHYIMKKKSGFYQDGIGRRLTDNAIAENALLNFALEGEWMTNMVTPITENQDVIDAFIEKRFTHGIPIEAEPQSVDFLQKYMKPYDVDGSINLLKMIMQSNDEKSRVSGLMSGKESPLDPRAPAEKVVSLLAMSGIDIADYVETLAPAFNEIGYMVLNLYYQMSKEPLKFRPKTEQVVGDNPFILIDKSDLIARTNISVMAYAFNFEKVNEKKEDLSLYSILRKEPIMAKNPEAVWQMLRQMVKAWSPKWRNQVDTILPPLEDLRKATAQAALQAVMIYMQNKLQQSQQTGQPQEFKAEELIPLVADLRAEVATQPDKKVLKEREKMSKQIQKQAQGVMTHA